MSETSYHLLIVDDEEGPRQSIRMVFHKEYSVHLADNAEKAIAIANAYPIDAAILDIRMAGISGIELLGKLKEKDPAIEVIILTAYETLETARQALRHGARDYLGKPFDVETLRGSVSNALMHRKISQRISQAETELQRLSGELKDAVAREDMTQTLNQVYAGVLHDINNPLTIIQCFIDLLLEQVEDARTMDEKEIEQFREKLSLVSRQIKTCSQIASRHIDFLRPSRTKDNRTSVNQAIDDLREMMRVHPIFKRGEIVVDPIEEELMARIRNAELIQVLLNLVLNSLQNARVNHAVTITAKEHLEPVRLDKDSDTVRVLHRDSFKNEAPIISIEVSDQSGGISPEILDNIFEPYFTTREHEKGTGLGLYIVSKIIESCGGALRLETKIGHGTSIQVFLPSV